MPNSTSRILAVRDEAESRAFDEPGAWWPDQPTVVGGRDRTAGGTWCVSDVDSGVTALVLDRPEPRAGTPTRGLLPLLAVAHGDGWVDRVPYDTMAGFTLVLVTAESLTAWEWDGDTLRRSLLSAGLHVMTPRGVDPRDARSQRIAPLFAVQPWLDVLRGEQRSDSDDTLFVRHEVDGVVYGTVFAQIIEAQPGALTVTSTRTPWDGGWRTATWPL